MNYKRFVGNLALFGAAVLIGAVRLVSAAQPAAVTPDEALKRLQDGNRRFATDRPIHGAHHRKRMAEVVNTQKPFAVVVACSDSRVAPEIVFDDDLGEIFVVRSAGHVVDDVELGSIEYGVEHLGASLVFMVGHERCGAVAAALSGEAAEGHVSAVIKAILPSVQSTRGQPGDHAENAMRANVRRVVRQLEADEPVLTERVKTGKLKIVGARYDLDTGLVELLR